MNINENAARTLEYAYDDWCIYRLAKELKRPQEEITLFAKRALNYKNLFDTESKLMRGKNRNGEFQKPFSPLKWGDAFTEGNSWHYSWSVFHDPQGLINLMGGKEMFVTMLDSVFAVPPVFDDSYYGQVIHEIREMTVMNMGNYAHGNQPIQHMIYLYAYAGQPWKAQYWLREVMNRMYTSAPDGYCGDEDNGQTSAWYVFSALGFYPVCPGTDNHKKILSHIQSHFSFAGLGIYISLCTGLRIGEVCALKWSDINVSEGTITVNRTIERIYIINGMEKHTELVINTPKTQNSCREIPITKELLAMVKPLKKVVNEEFYVLTNDEYPTEPRTYRNYYGKLMAKLGIPKLKYHGLRHSFATRCIEAGCDYKTVSVLLGHSNISTTLDLYVHPNMEQKKRCIAKVFKSLGK